MKNNQQKKNKLYSDSLPLQSSIHPRKTGIINIIKFWFRYIFKLKLSESNLVETQRLQNELFNLSLGKLKRHVDPPILDINLNRFYGIKEDESLPGNKIKFPWYYIVWPIKYLFIKKIKKK